LQHCGSHLFLKAPQIEDKQVRIESFDPQHLNLKILLKVNNPNSEALHIEKLRAELKASGTSLFDKTWTELPVLAPQTVTAVELPLEIEWKSFLPLSLNLLAAQPVPYQLKAKIETHDFSLPFEKSGEWSQSETKFAPF